MSLKAPLAEGAFMLTHTYNDRTIETDTPNSDRGTQS